jgi:hypothetical protein
MPTEVVSPVTRRGSKVSGNEPCSSPGARSMPSSRNDSVPAQPAHGGTGGHVSRMSTEEPSPFEPRTQVTGPEG